MTLDCRVGHRRQARLGQDPQRVLLAGRLNQPGGNELAEDLVSTVESFSPTAFQAVSRASRSTPIRLKVIDATHSAPAGACGPDPATFVPLRPGRSTLSWPALSRCLAISLSAAARRHHGPSQCARCCVPPSWRSARSAPHGPPTPS